MSEFKPCYKCGSENAERVKFTWWGGLLGPKLLTHVKCQGCGTGYSGKTGESNSTKIAIYIAVSFAIIIPIVILIACSGLFIKA